MRVEWRSIALASEVVAAGLLIALVVVASKVKADALATTALALAIIAFGAQLLVYIAQVADSTDTRRQASEVNAATQASLARIGTTVAKSDELLRTQYTQIMQNLLSNVRQAGIEAKENDSSLTVAGIVELLEARAAGDDGLAGIPDLPPNPFVYRNTDLEEDYFDWPETYDEARSAEQSLLGLHPIAIAQLMRFAEDVVASDSVGIDPGMVIGDPSDSPYSHQLLSAGLIERTGRFPRGRPPKNRERDEIAVLTDRGHAAAQLLMPRGTAPAYIRQLILGADSTTKADES